MKLAWKKTHENLMGVFILKIIRDYRGGGGGGRRDDHDDRRDRDRSKYFFVISDLMSYSTRVELRNSRQTFFTTF